MMTEAVDTLSPDQAERSVAVQRELIAPPRGSHGGPTIATRIENLGATETHPEIQSEQQQMERMLARLNQLDRR